MLSGHFIPSPEGKLFVTQFGTLDSDTAILCLPSITEELNLARAVVAKQAQMFAQQDMPCFVLDYFGTGDSEGEFEQADCDLWLKNVLTAGEWLKQQGFSKIILWGVRFGGLLMLAHQEALHQRLPIVRQILWKPVISGKQFAGQFLRIKQANSMMHQSSEKINWRQHILDGNNTEVAGYVVTAKMLASIDLLQLQDKIQPLSPITWFELATSVVSPAINNVLKAWPKECYHIHCFDGVAFWKIPEVFSQGHLHEPTFDSVRPML
jgi:exosortase A-associated hydrolase 2